MDNGIRDFLSQLKDNHGITPNEQVLKIEYVHNGRRMITIIDYNPATQTYHTGTLRDVEGSGIEMNMKLV